MGPYTKPLPFRPRGKLSPPLLARRWQHPLSSWTASYALLGSTEQIAGCGETRHGEGAGACHLSHCHPSTSLTPYHLGMFILHPNLKSCRIQDLQHHCLHHLDRSPSVYIMSTDLHHYLHHVDGSPSVFFLISTDLFQCLYHLDGSPTLSIISTDLHHYLYHLDGAQSLSVSSRRISITLYHLDGSPTMSTSSRRISISIYIISTDLQHHCLYHLD